MRMRFLSNALVILVLVDVMVFGFLLLFSQSPDLTKYRSSVASGVMLAATVAILLHLAIFMYVSYRVYMEVETVAAQFRRIVDKRRSTLNGGDAPGDSLNAKNETLKALMRYMRGELREKTGDASVVELHETQ